MPFWLAAGLGLAAGGFAWRWRGAGHLGAGRILCALPVGAILCSTW